MSSELQLTHSLSEDDALAASQSLEEELLGQGYLMEAPMGSSLAAELESAAFPSHNSILSTLAMGPPLSTSMRGSLDTSFSTQSHYDTQKKIEDFSTEHPTINLKRGTHEDAMFDATSPSLSPLQWNSSIVAYGRSRRSSFSSTWSSLDQEDDDPFEALKKQLEELNSAVWETKTLHKRLLNTLLADEMLQTKKPYGSHGKPTVSDSFAPPLELVIASVVNLIDRKSRDRERQASYLKTVDGALRKEGASMDLETIKELESLVGLLKTTLYDQQYSYENPLPAIRKLNHETSSMTDTLEELKELMYVNKHQVQELNSRLRSIAKTVHEIRKDIRRINKFLEEKDDDDAVVLEKGEVQARVKDIMWGLDDLDKDSTKKLRQMQLFWESQDGLTASAS
ncbi:hypothetical protein BDF14DRAFT_1764052 [Spinellus fusiger]|nr:hypothetical protein BDF14DRAFT_1764052 [Spinellus fusiger]